MPVRQQVNGAARVAVHQDRAVDLTFAQREVIHPQHVWRTGRSGCGQPHHHAKQGHPAHRGTQDGGEPGPGPPGQGQTDSLEHLQQYRGAPPIADAQTFDLLAEGVPGATRLVAEQAPHRQLDENRLPTHCGVSNLASVAAMHSSRQHPAARARKRTVLDGPRRDPHHRIHWAHLLHYDPVQMREDHPQQFLTQSQRSHRSASPSTFTKFVPEPDIWRGFCSDKCHFPPSLADSFTGHHWWSAAGTIFGRPVPCLRLDRRKASDRRPRPVPKENSAPSSPVDRLVPGPPCTGTNKHWEPPQLRRSINSLAPYDTFRSTGPIWSAGNLSRGLQTTTGYVTGSTGFAVGVSTK